MKPKDTVAQEAIEKLMGDGVPGDSRRTRQLERRRAIAEAVVAEGSMRIETLTERFNISLMTAHRDLDELVRHGILNKTRGVVSASPTSLIEASDLYRGTRQRVEKEAIARAALSRIEPGQAIFMDDSTTVLAMAAHLESKTPLTVITHSLTLMNRLKDLEELTLIGLGGQFHHWCNAFMGRLTVSEISGLRADQFFASMAAIVDDQLFHQSPEMVETKRAMLDASATRTLLADHTKFERRALHRLGAIREFDTIIVDDGTSIEHVDRLRNSGVDVMIANVEEESLGNASWH